MPQSGFEDGFTLTTSGSLDSWVKEIHAKVPGSVEGYIYDQVKAVIRDFFQRTKAWQSYLGPFTAVANDGTICLNPVDNYSNVIQVLGVYKTGSKLTPLNSSAVAGTLSSGTVSSGTSCYYLEPYHTINFVPAPTKDLDDIYVAAALTPRLRSDNRISEWVVEQCYEAVRAGTLQRLYEEPNKVYSNVASAELWGRRYRTELSRSRSVAIQNYSQSRQVFPVGTR